MLFSCVFNTLLGVVVTVIVWSLDLQLPMKSLSAYHH